MNILIDDKILAQTKFLGNTLTVSEFLLCLIIKAGDNPEQVLSSLIEKEIIVKDLYDNNKYYIKSTCYESFQRVLFDSDKSIPTITALDELVIKLQELFPKGSKIYTSQNGAKSKISWRGNRVDLTTRFQKFFKIYGNKPFDTVYNCVKKYTESYKYDNTYMKTLPYYIMKDGESQLATELENMEDDPQEVTNPNEDWTNTLL